MSNIHERKIRESLEINNLETKAEYDKLTWQINTFCFAHKCKHNANTNYDTNTNKKPRPHILTPGRVFKCAAASFTKAICILFKITIK